MSTQVDVWWGETRVATVASRRGQMTTTYTSAAAPMLTVAMPPRTRAYGERQSHPFFHGLLPEGETRSKIAYDLGLGNTGGDDLDLLGAIGRDCAGALVIVPAGTPPPRPSAGGLERLTNLEVERRIRDLPDHPLGVDQRVRLSLPGVQNKLLLARTDDGTWHLPIDGAPSTHILKPGLRGWPGSVDNEVLCQNIAANAGVQAAETTRMQFEDLTVLVSRRFDRSIEPDGTVTRLHQEDACQALSVLTVPLERKCQTDPAGQPSFHGVAAILDRWGDAGSRDRLLDQMTINIVLGNADLHGKNITLVHRDGQVALSPAYDILSTTALGDDLSTAVGLLVDAETNIHRITPTHLVNEAVGWGIRRARATNRVGALLDRLPDAIQTAAYEHPDAPGQLVDHLTERAEQARRAFTSPPNTGTAKASSKPNGPDGKVRPYRPSDGTEISGQSRRRPGGGGGSPARPW